MAKARARGTAREERDTARSLRHSLESTQQGLSTLLSSLDASGLREAATSYERLYLVLTQQRLWTQSHRRTELLPLWRGIARTARDIHEILAGFDRVMDRLKDIYRVTSSRASPLRTDRETRDGADDDALPLASAPKATPSPTREAAEELASLMLDRIYVSRLQLTRENTTMAKVDDLIAVLERLGTVERRGWGRSISYRIGKDARERLRCALVDFLAVEEHELPR